tara:strand:+ start:19991 stop:20593 length:603 start_codon:yes stop_codon:yes gene_type:complete
MKQTALFDDGLTNLAKHLDTNPYHGCIQELLENTRPFKYEEGLMIQEHINNACLWRDDNEDFVVRMVAKARPSEYVEPDSEIAAVPAKWLCEHWGWFFNSNLKYYVVQYAECRGAVWVHCSDGSTVGRFGRQGVDIHTTVTEQLAGAKQCRLCTHGVPTKKEWKMFINKAYEYWGVVIPDDTFDHKLLADTGADSEVDIS